MYSRLLSLFRRHKREITLAPFFPNQSPGDLREERHLRKATASVSQDERLRAYAAISASRPSFTPTSFRLQDGCVLAHQCGRDIAFADPVPPVILSHIVFGYEEMLGRKYWLPGFVEVEPGDIVVDCGAFVGGFSLSASKVAKEVHAFEPDEANFKALTRNFKQDAHVVLNNCGLYSQSKTMTLNVSASSVEHSLLMPDDGPPVATRTIEVVTLHDYCRRAGIQAIDFCKIEAEGVEIEVFEGLMGMRPRKLAIDVSPERDGQSPADELIQRLAPMGYEVQRRGNVLFARNRSTTRDLTSCPKVIYSLWLQGRDNAPDLVRYVFDRWTRLNPGYQLKVLDSSDVNNLLKDCGLDVSSLSPQALSDIVRLRLLRDHGGIWADASLLPLVPLDQWLPQAMQRIGFFAFDRDDVPLSSWFLAAAPQNPVILAWWEQVERLWASTHQISARRFIPTDPVASVDPDCLASGQEVTYFWVHCLFQYVLAKNPVVSDIWRRREPLAAPSAHTLQKLFAKNANPRDGQILEAATKSPVQKLDWRKVYPLDRFEQLLTGAGH